MDGETIVARLSSIHPDGHAAHLPCAVHPDGRYAWRLWRGAVDTGLPEMAGETRHGDVPRAHKQHFLLAKRGGDLQLTKDWRQHRSSLPSTHQAPAMSKMRRWRRPALRPQAAH